MNGSSSPALGAGTPPDDHLGAFVHPPTVLASGVPGGALDGATLGVKDLFDVAGTVTRAGNPDFARGRPPASRHASSVERLVAAGATVVGRTVTDELAFSLSGTNVHDGTPVNVAAPGRVPGGSSAGSAVAVAAQLVDLALGTDTGGSIRVPASYCGILGWRPTHGIVPVDGVVPLAPSFDTVGLLARDANVLAAGASVLGGFEVPGRAPGRTVRLLGDSLDVVADEVATEVRRVAGQLGATDADVRLRIDVDAALGAFRTRQLWEAWETHGEWIASTSPSMGPGVAARFAAAARVERGDVVEADRTRAAVVDSVLAATADGTFLLAPAAAGAAPPLGSSGPEHEATRVATLRLTCIAGLAGAPVVVLPLGRHDGCPLGIAAIAAPGDDAALLAWAVRTMHDLRPSTSIGTGT